MAHLFHRDTNTRWPELQGLVSAGHGMLLAQFQKKRWGDGLSGE